MKEYLIAYATSSGTFGNYKFRPTPSGDNPHPLQLIEALKLGIAQREQIRHGQSTDPSTITILNVMEIP